MLPAEQNPYRTALTASLRPRLSESVDLIHARFMRLGQRAVLVGPHGSGKTTLLEALAPLLGEVTWLRLRADRAENRAALQALPQRIAGVLVLDGLEQLSPWAWWRIARRAPHILATSHHAHRLPVLRYHTTDANLLANVIRDLGQEPPNDVDELFHRHHCNIRDCLRELYDRVACSLPPTQQITDTR